MSATPSLSIVLFAYNEEENIGPVLGELRAWLQAHHPRAEVIFVDDGSTDATGAAAAKALEGFTHTIVRHERNRGIGTWLLEKLQREHEALELQVLTDSPARRLYERQGFVVTSEDALHVHMRWLRTP